MSSVGATSDEMGAVADAYASFLTAALRDDPLVADLFPLLTGGYNDGGNGGEGKEKNKGETNEAAICGADGLGDVGFPLPFFQAFRDGRLLTAVVNFALVSLANDDDGTAAAVAAAAASAAAAATAAATAAAAAAAPAWSWSFGGGTDVATKKKAAGTATLKVISDALERCRTAAAAPTALRAAAKAADAADVAAGRPSAILAVLRPLVAAAVAAVVSILHRPELFRLLEDDEDLEEFYRRSAEEILLRWVNFHVAAAITAGTVSISGGTAGGSATGATAAPQPLVAVPDLGRGLRDGRAYSALLRQLDFSPVAGVRSGSGSIGSALSHRSSGSGSGSGAGVAEILDAYDSGAGVTAERVLASARALGVAAPLPTPAEIAAGDAAANALLLAQLFAARTGLPPLTPFEARLLVTAVDRIADGTVAATLRRQVTSNGGGASGSPTRTPPAGADTAADAVGEAANFRTGWRRVAAASEDDIAPQCFICGIGDAFDGVCSGGGSPEWPLCGQSEIEAIARGDSKDDGVVAQGGSGGSRGGGGGGGESEKGGTNSGGGCGGYVDLRSVPAIDLGDGGQTAVVTASSLNSGSYSAGGFSAREGDFAAGAASRAAKPPRPPQQEQPQPMPAPSAEGKGYGSLPSSVYEASRARDSRGSSQAQQVLLQPKQQGNEVCTVS